MKKFVFLLTLAASFAGAFGAEAPKFAYHGQLSKPNGTAFDTSLPLVIAFNLYADANDKVPIWGRIMPIKMSATGLFYAELSDEAGTPVSGARSSAIATALAGTTNGVWIGITPAGASEISPRQFFSHVWRAARAEVATHVKQYNAPELNVSGEVTLLSGIINELRAADVRTESSGSITYDLPYGTPNMAVRAENIVITERADIITSVRNAGNIPQMAITDTFILWKNMTRQQNGYATLIYPNAYFIDQYNLGALGSDVYSFGRGLK